MSAATHRATRPKADRTNKAGFTPAQVQTIGSQCAYLLSTLPKADIAPRDSVASFRRWLDSCQQSDVRAEYRREFAVKCPGMTAEYKIRGSFLFEFATRVGYRGLKVGNSEVNQ